MKKVIGWIGVAVLGASAVGCGADVNGGASIGSASLPLTQIEDTGTAAPRKEQASCVIRDLVNSRDLFLIYGGRDAAGPSAKPESLLYDPVADTWTKKQTQYTPLGGGGLTNMPSLTKPQMIGVPGEDQCILVGGTTSNSASAANAVATAYKYDLSANTWTQLTSMAQARIDFPIATCGSGTGNNARILVFGGVNNGGEADIEMLDVGANSGAGSWSTISFAANRQRSKLSVAPLTMTNPSKFVIAGGETGGAQSAKVDLLSFSSTNPCSSPTLVAGKQSNAAEDLPAARSEPAAFFEGTVAGAGPTYDTFNVVGGTANGTTGQTTRYKLEVLDWTSATDNLQVTTPGTQNLATGRFGLVALPYNTNVNGRYAVVAGKTGASTGSAKVQVWDPINKDFNAEEDLTTARFDFAGQYVPSEGRIITAGGSTSGTAIAATEAY